MNNTLLVIIVFLCSLGVFYVINLLQNFIFDDSTDFKKYSKIKVVPLSGRVENLEYLIRKHFAKNKRKKRFKHTKLIFIDTGVDKETNNILKKMRKTYNFTICEKSKIYDTIKKNLDI